MYQIYYKNNFNKLETIKLKSISLEHARTLALEQIENCTEVVKVEEI